MSDTSIQWTDAVWNPVRGCSRVSEGCGGSTGGGCYAERQAHRFSNPGGPYEGLTRMTEKGPRWTGKIRLVPELLAEPLRWRKPRMVFVNSMSDLFHEDVPDEFIDQVFAVMALACRHAFQVLTKRPERMLAYLQQPNRPGLVGDEAVKLRTDDKPVGPLPHLDGGETWWPLPNVWLGTSVENQETADERIPVLLQTPAAVRFISAEPLLGPVDLRPWLTGGSCPACASADGLVGVRPTRADPGLWYCRRPGCRDRDGFGAWGLDWVIPGGESGPGARPCDVAWLRSLVEQCRTAGIACFMKQLGAVVMFDPADPANPDLTPTTQLGTLPEGWSGRRRWRLALRDRKGGDPEEWPADIRVRDFPR